MKSLIRFIATLLAEHIQRGSRRGAFIGLFCGVGSGVLLAGPLWWFDVTGSLGAATFITLTLLGAIAGPAIGASFPSAEPAPDPTKLRSIRVTNLNKALLPLSIFVLLLIIPVIG